jgi:alanine racemase
MTTASGPPPPTTLVVDLAAAAANVRAVRAMVGAERMIFAVVKADGYGHGAAELGAVFAAHGADALAVADLGEGIRLRQRGITAPILVYPNALPEAAPDALAHDLTPTLVDPRLHHLTRRRFGKILGGSSRATHPISSLA